MSRLLQLPAEGYKYNLEQDTINLLVRDPHCLYVYWDISQNRKNLLSDTLGTEKYNKSVPVLKVTNITKNESFFIRINDFSTDWYITVPDQNSTYIVEIGRKLNDDLFISILNSNSIITPAENISHNKSAYYANYNHVREGKYELIPDKSGRPGLIDEDNAYISEISSRENFQKNKSGKKFGISSAEFAPNAAKKPD